MRLLMAYSHGTLSEEELAELLRLLERVAAHATLCLTPKKRKGVYATAAKALAEAPTQASEHAA